MGDEVAINASRKHDDSGVIRCPGEALEHAHQIGQAATLIQLLGGGVKVSTATPSVNPSEIVDTP
jgi:hypothetical protein